MMIFYFTSTGNSLYVAKQMGGQLLSIPQMLKENKKTFKDSAIGFVFPCYFLGVPNIVKKFIEKSKFEADYFFGVMTYGSMSASGLTCIEKIGKKVNINFNYTAEILMIDNYLPMFKIEDELEKEADKSIEENLKVIVEDIKKRSNKKIQKWVGNKAITTIALLFMPKGCSDNKFNVNDNCTNCGICQKVCPKGNISIKGKPIYVHNCDFCMGCINLCPQNAIQLKNQKSDARFINQNVKLQEIISANNQAE